MLIASDAKEFMKAIEELGQTQRANKEQKT